MNIKSWFARAESQPHVQRSAQELQQYVEQRFLEREIVTNTTELAKAFESVMNAMDGSSKAVVLIGNLLIAKHSLNGVDHTFAQTLSARQLDHVHENPGILASPDKVLEMLALAMATSPQSAALPPGGATGGGA